jgi:hypothetical protein
LLHLFFCSLAPLLVLLLLLLYSLVLLGFVASLLFCLWMPQAKFCCSCSFAHWYFFRFCYFYSFVRQCISYFYCSCYFGCWCLLVLLFFFFFFGLSVFFFSSTTF